MPPDPTTIEVIELHGRRVAVRRTGRGPVLLLVHGLAGDLHTWDRVVPALAGRYTVIAPDLPGHGHSDAPAGDYSLGANASWLRDLLDALGHDAATVIGHSLGGGIALQFVYQFPDRCQRLVLVASGGLGPDVNLALRAASLPGSEQVLSVVAHRQVVAAGNWLADGMRTLRIPVPRGVVETARGYGRLADPVDRRSFVNSVRSVVDHRGQRISAVDRLHLLAEVPTLIVWGADDRIIPVEHARAAHEAIPGSRLEVFAGTGHFPHASHPRRFATAVDTFLTQHGCGSARDA